MTNQSTTIVDEEPPAAPVVVPRELRPRPNRSDRIYRAAGGAAALATFVILTLIGYFLFQKGLPELRADGWGFFTHDKWTAVGPFGLRAVLYWTVVIAIIGLVFAVPLSIALALFITEYAPRRVAKGLTALVDLLAAIPSLLVGLWALNYLQPQLGPIARWLSTHLSFIPFLSSNGSNFKSSAFVAGMVVALMITPIITSVVREVLSQTPAGEKEAALALGSTRWGMIRTVALPYGRGGIIGGSMLGLGRALGETIVVVLIISPSFEVSRHVLQSGANSVSALIALRIGDAHGIAVNALMAAGFALFVLTLLVNAAATVVVHRSRSGVGVDL